VFRGISYWAAGKVMAVCDKPRDPVYTFTNANVIDGRFTYQGTSRQARHTVAMVHWGDPNDFGRGKIEYVPDDEAIARYGIQILTMTAIGATSQGQAHRCGRWALLTEQMETNTVTFDVGLDGCIPQPGQVVRIADKMRSGPRIGGRVRAATSSVITPDAMPTASIGDLLTVVLPTAVTQTRPVSAVGVDTISVSPAFDTAPVAHAAWVIESPELVAGLFNVVGVDENAGLQYTVMAMQHAPEKFAAADFGIVIQPQNTSQIPPKTIAPPESVTISSHIVSDPVPRRVVVIEWPAVVGASRYEVSWQRNMSDWSSPVSVNTRRYEIDNALPGDYKARVKAVTSTGLASLDRISDTVVIPVIVMPEILLSDTSSDILYDETESYILYSEPA
jgi:predicted phage tail protein